MWNVAGFDAAHLHGCGIVVFHLYFGQFSLFFCVGSSPIWPIGVTLPESGLRIDVLFEGFERGNHHSLGVAADSEFDYEDTGGVCSLLCCSDDIAAPNETFLRDE